MSSDSTEPSNDEGHSKEAGKGSNHQRRASAAALIDAFAQQYQADREEASGRERHRIFREWLTIIGLFLAAVVAFFQWRELRSTDHNIAEQARISIEQLKLASFTAERQLRAYVYVEGGQIVVTPDGGGFVAQVVFKNFGQTPANEYSTWLGGAVYEYDALPFPKERKPLADRVNRSIVGPTAVTPITTKSATLGDIADIRSGKKAIFVWGGVDYVDAFGKQRYLYIRASMSGPELDFGNGRRGWLLTPHPVGYESD